MVIEKLTPTRINTYMSCPFRYACRYVRDLVIPPPNSALTLGSTVHGAVGHNLEQKIDSGEDMKRGDLKEYFASIFELEQSHTVWYSDEDPGKFKDLGVKIVDVHRQLVSPGIIPVAVEKGFILTLTAKKKPGDDPDKPPKKYPPLEGHVDTVTKDSKVVEMKTTRAKPKAPKPEHKFQATFYAAGMILAGTDLDAAQYDYMVKTKSPYPVSFTEPITKNDWMFFQVMLDQVTRGIENDVFPPNRTFYGCSRRWCGYWPICEEECGGRVPD